MSLDEYKPGTAFPGRIERTIGESTPAWPAPVRAKEGAPNVLFIVIDDTGFGQLGCYGGVANTPNLDRLVKNGLLYTNMQTTALWLTGRGRAFSRDGITTRTACRASPRARKDTRVRTGAIPVENGFLAEMLLQHGYNTYAVGKWHLTPAEQISAAGPYDRCWPLWAGASSATTVFSAAIRASTTRISSTTIVRSIHQRHRLRAITSRRI